MEFVTPAGKPKDDDMIQRFKRGELFTSFLDLVLLSPKLAPNISLFTSSYRLSLVVPRDLSS